jgi:hypothetical protein
MTIAYVRVSAEDRVEFTPDAQAKRCKDLARLHNSATAPANAHPTRVKSYCA